MNINRHSKDVNCFIAVDVMRIVINVTKTFIWTLSQYPRLAQSACWLSNCPCVFVVEHTSCDLHHHWYGFFCFSHTANITTHQLLYHCPGVCTTPLSWRHNVESLQNNGVWIKRRKHIRLIHNQITDSIHIRISYLVDKLYITSNTETIRISDMQWRECGL